MADDVTGDAAMGNIAGDIVLNTVLTALKDELDQVLVLTHLALGIPLPPLARDLQIDRQELQARVARIRTELPRDEGLSARLSGIRRAGQIEHYYPIIAHVGLQNWFCARPGCPNLIIQSKTGRPRKTCSSRCRSRLHRHKGIAWEERDGGGSSQESGMLDAEEHVTEDAIARTFILQLMRPINYPSPRSHWDQPNIHCRDRALLLLGFTCSVPISVVELHDLNINDVGKASEGLEVRLYKRQNGQATRYITIPTSDDPRLCAARALLSWQRVLARSGRTSGPLFPRLGSTGRLPENSRRLSSNAAADLIWQALRWWRSEIWDYGNFKFNNSMPLSDFLKEIIANNGFREAVSMLEPGPDHLLGPDPCERRNDWAL